MKTYPSLPIKSIDYSKSATTIFNITLLLAIVSCSIASSSLKVIAQIVPDRTLPENSAVNDSGKIQTITGGTKADSNLFHSFEQFSVGTGNMAFFNNATDIQNIITRVTGSNISSIDGILRTNGNANLFLINPNGILFGKNASLAIAGSFVASTANSLRFADGSEFSTTNPSTSPLLTVSIPVGLQLGHNPGAIKVEGVGKSEVFPNTNLGLAAAPGKTLALIGGDVTFTGGIASAIAGRLEVGSAANGEVNLTPISVGWRLGYEKVGDFRNIKLLNNSSLWNPNFNLNPEGGIRLQAGNITLNNSQIATMTLGSPSGGNLEIDAAKSLEIGGVNPSVFPFSSWIVSQVAQGATGKGGDIQIATPNLTIQDGGAIETMSLGNGNAGELNIEANSLLVNGYSPLSSQPSLKQQNLNSRIASTNTSKGSGGNINVSSREITFRDGGQIATSVAPQATGNGGNVTVEATNSVTAIGLNPLNDSLNGGILSWGMGSGKGGNLALSTSRLTLQDGASIESQVFSTGRGGDINVTATDSLSLTGVSSIAPNYFASSINAFTASSANTGDISVSTGQLTISDGAAISSTVLTQVPAPNAGTGNAGNITIDADRSVEIVGTTPLDPDAPSAITNVTFGSGNAGNIQLSTQRLLLKDGGILSSGVALPFDVKSNNLVAGAGTGKGGNLSVNASDSIEVTGINPLILTPTSLTSFTSGFGDAGDTSINTSRLIVKDGGIVSSSTGATGNAGKLNLNADEILVSGTSQNSFPTQISATASILDEVTRKTYSLPAFPTGNTGEVTINTGSLILKDRGQLSVQHQGTGNAGKLNVFADAIALDNGGEITASTASGKGGNINLQVKDALLLSDRSSITAEAGGIGDGGNIDIEALVMAAKNNSDIVANAIEGRGGNIQIKTKGLFGIEFRQQLTPESDINASSQFGIDGVVQLNRLDIDPSQGLIELPETAIDPATRMTRTCSSNSNNNLAVIGRGGLPETPTQTLRGQNIWQDFRPLPLVENPETTKQKYDRQLTNSPSPIIEAQGWIIKEDGKIQLLARSSNFTSDRVWQTPNQCH